MPRRTKAQELLEFEILFYEKLLHAYPQFVDVLVPLAEAYTRRGWYEKGLAIDLQLLKLRGNDPLTWYNVCCSYSLLGRVDDALHALQQAFQLGYTDLAFLSKDPDLENVRRSPKFRQLLESLVSRQPT